eukprot:gene10132-8032_t
MHPLFQPSQRSFLRTRTRALRLVNGRVQVQQTGARPSRSVLLCSCSGGKWMVDAFARKQEPQWMVDAFARKQEPQVVAAVKQTVNNVVGTLHGTDYFDVRITTVADNLSQLFTAMLMTGYLFRAASVRMKITSSLASSMFDDAATENSTQGDILRWHLEHGVEKVPANEYISMLQAELIIPSALTAPPKPSLERHFSGEDRSLSVLPVTAAAVGSAVLGRDNNLLDYLRALPQQAVNELTSGATPDTVEAMQFFVARLQGTGDNNQLRGTTSEFSGHELSKVLQWLLVSTHALGRSHNHMRPIAQSKMKSFLCGQHAPGSIPVSPRSGYNIHSQLSLPLRCLSSTANSNATTVSVTEAEREQAPIREIREIREIRTGRSIRIAPPNGSGGRDTLHGIKQRLGELFLPDGYPSSVSKDYLDYQLWSVPCHITGWLSHSLTTSSLLQAVGISAGPGGTILTAAASTWIINDGIGATGKFIDLLEFENDPDVSKSLDAGKDPSPWECVLADVIGTSTARSLGAQCRDCSGLSSSRAGNTAELSFEGAGDIPHEELQLAIELVTQKLVSMLEGTVETVLVPDVLTSAAVPDSIGHFMAAEAWFARLPCVVYDAWSMDRGIKFLVRTEGRNAVRVDHRRAVHPNGMTEDVRPPPSCRRGPHRKASEDGATRSRAAGGVMPLPTSPKKLQ